MKPPCVILVAVLLLVTTLDKPCFAERVVASSSVTLSADASTAAYVAVDRVSLPIPPHPPMLAQTAHVRVFEVAQPDEERSIEIAKVGPEHSDLPVETEIRLSFSPDSKRLAVVVSGKLSIIDVSSGRLFALTQPGEQATSFVWAGSNEIRYATHSNVRGAYEETSDRTFWVHTVEGAGAGRRAVHQEKGVRAGTMFATVEWPLERWSPRGNYVVFKSSFHGGRFRLLDVGTGAVQEFGQSKAYSVGVSWRGDESAALCLSRAIGATGSCEALLVDTASGDTEELGEFFEGAFGEEELTIEPLATHDGQYFLVNSLYYGGCLVRPRPWRVVYAGERLCEEVASGEGPRPWLYLMPVAGWLWGPMEEGMYAIDYAGEKAVPIDGPGFACSADGDFGLKYDWGTGKVVMFPLGLTPAP